MAGVIVAAVAAWLALGAANEADTTAKRLQGIEQERRLDERLEDLAAAQITRYFSSPCDQAAKMLAPTIDRFYDDQNKKRGAVLDECEAGPKQRMFVLHEIDVIGTPDSDQVYALVDLGFYDADTDGGGHDVVGVTSLEVVMELSAGWEDADDPTFPISRITETVEDA